MREQVAGFDQSAWVRRSWPCLTTADGATLTAATDVELAWAWAAHTVGGDTWTTIATAERWAVTAYALVELRRDRACGIVTPHRVQRLRAEHVARVWRNGDDRAALETLLRDLESLRDEVAPTWPTGGDHPVAEVIAECRQLLNGRSTARQ